MKITNGVALIGESAFDKCISLKSIVIPTSVNTIYANAFANCSALNAIYFAGSVNQWDRIEIIGGNAITTDAAIVYNYVPA